MMTSDMGDDERKFEWSFRLISESHLLLGSIKTGIKFSRPLMTANESDVFRLTSDSIRELSAHSKTVQEKFW